MNKFSTCRKALQVFRPINVVSFNFNAEKVKAKKTILKQFESKFHNDVTLTEKNLRLTSSIVLGMNILYL